MMIDKHPEFPATGKSKGQKSAAPFHSHVNLSPQDQQNCAVDNQCIAEPQLGHSNVVIYCTLITRRLATHLFLLQFLASQQGFHWRANKASTGAPACGGITAVPMRIPADTTNLPSGVIGTISPKPVRVGIVLM
jgi:hypothetical protein